MTLLECVREAWGWKGLDAIAIVDKNAFGNLLVRDVDGRVWLIRPETLSCDVVAEDDRAYARLRADTGFVSDWSMDRLVALATRRVGPLADGQSYCLKIPAAIGGAFDESNLASLSTVELVGVSGDIAMQIKDLPDGTPIEIKIVD